MCTEGLCSGEKQNNPDDLTAGGMDKYIWHIYIMEYYLTPKRKQTSKCNNFDERQKYVKQKMISKKNI